MLLTSLPIVSTFVAKFFYCDNYRISNHNKNPAYVLIPGSGTIDISGQKSGQKFPTTETIKRAWHGYK